MKIAVLISGGVDSAVAVELLHREGTTCIPVLTSASANDTDEGDCSAEEEDIEMCTLIARRYEIFHFHVVSLHEEYWDSVMATHSRAPSGKASPRIPT